MARAAAAATIKAIPPPASLLKSARWTDGGRRRGLRVLSGIALAGRYPEHTQPLEQTTRNEGSCLDVWRPLLRRRESDAAQPVQSCVRPACAALMAAGPDELDGGPELKQLTAPGERSLLRGQHQRPEVLHPRAGRVETGDADMGGVAHQEVLVVLARGLPLRDRRVERRGAGGEVLGRAGAIGGAEGSEPDGEAAAGVVRQLADLGVGTRLRRRDGVEAPVDRDRAEAAAHPVGRDHRGGAAGIDRHLVRRVARRRAAAAGKARGDEDKNQDTHRDPTLLSEVSPSFPAEAWQQPLPDHDGVRVPPDLPLGAADESAQSGIIMTGRPPLGGARRRGGQSLAIGHTTRISGTPTTSTISDSGAPRRL